jgi:phage-related protein
MAREKPIRWSGSAYDDLIGFPPEARRLVGFQLGLIQLGYEPHDWKPFESAGTGVKEIRVRAENNQYRSLYVAKFEEAIYVLHCFVKKEEKTSKHDVEITRTRYREIVRIRSKQ